MVCTVHVCFGLEAHRSTVEALQHEELTFTRHTVYAVYACVCACILKGVTQ